MEEQKNCIFHVPNHINLEAKSGSHIRPKKMMDSFRDIGYNVDVVMGYGKERKKQIKEIKNKILQGKKYDFLYSESSTMPTLLTEKSHFPLYPTLDFGFLNFCKKRGIKIGLFYRDIYWKFPVYKEKVPFLKRVPAVLMYKYDLKKYEQIVDILYLPSNKMKSYIGISKKSLELPPGCMESEQGAGVREKNKCEEGFISLFYVGGIGTIYNLNKLFSVVKKLDCVKLVVCCREEEWKANKKYYEQYMNDRIEIIHKSGNELKEYYSNADICMLFFESDEYRSFAMPIKLFEYLGNMCPIIGTVGTAAGEFIESNDIGWSILYDEYELEKLLKNLSNNRMILEEKRNGMRKVMIQNTWQERARTVVRDLI